MSKKGLAVLGVGALLVVGAGFAGFRMLRTDAGEKTNQAVFAVAKGPLTISVIASGTVKAREQIILKNEVEGRTSIIYLVPEGTLVKEGDLLIELDASRLLDEKIEQEIRVQNSEAAFVSARENLAVVENQAQSDVDKAQLAYNFAKEDLKKDLEGEYPNQLKDADAKITLSREELTRAKERVDWSKRLHSEKYISETELVADELTMKRKDLELELAKSNLELLVNFTHQRKLAQLQSDVKQAGMALERTLRKAKADVIQAKANLGAKEAEFERQKAKLKKTEANIGKTKIYAPAAGQVIHATSAQGGGQGRRNVQPLEEGQEVRERQELINLPTTVAAKVEVAIHESSLDKVHIGLPVKVTVDALPGETMWGKVAKIAPLPDAQSAWLNPDLKVYNTDIYLDNMSKSLRNGMSCKAEIVVEQHPEALYIPVQAVLHVGGQATAFVLKGEKLEPRKIQTGLDNNRMVRIISGLALGELVSLTPPLSAASVEQGEYAKETAALPGRPEAGKAPGAVHAGPERQATEEGRPPEPAGGNGRRPGSRPPDDQGLKAAAGPVGPQPQADEGKAQKKAASKDQERRKQFFESLSPEERERFQGMSPEEKKKFRDARKGAR